MLNVVVKVEAFTAIFFGVPTSLKAGQKLTELWILAGLLGIVLNPFLDLVRYVRYVFHRIAALFRS